MSAQHRMMRAGSRRKATPGIAPFPRGKKKAPAQQDVLAFARLAWESIDTPKSLALYILSQNGEMEQLIRTDADPLHYLDPDDYFLDYQAVKLLSKNPHVPTGINTRTVALRKFVEFESLCRETNGRFRAEAMAGIPCHLSRILFSAQGKIASILGDVPSLEDMDFRFGPGAAFGVRGSTSVFHKVTSTLESTHSMIAALPEFMGEFPGWIQGPTAEVTIVWGSDLALVPKDAKTDRVICIEPLLNGLHQKGVGTYIRQRLRKHGVNLNDQSVNQGLAARAYAEDLATVDFSSASDSIAYNLVWSLLPPEWATLLDTSRCPRYRCEKQWYNFEKFSSMGNAYTFELESLIFYALAYACCVESGIRPLTGENLSVYGDDVIIPRDAFNLFREVSEYCGFKVNTTKTFTHGSFYESCGHDYFTGTLVTPLRLKIALRKPLELIYCANLVVRIAERLARIAEGRGTIEKHRARLLGLSRCHNWVVQKLPSRFMVFGPWTDSDQWLLAPFDRGLPSIGGVFGFRHRAVVTRPHREVSDWPMSYALYGAMDCRGSKDARDDLTAVVHSEGYSVPQRSSYRVMWAWSSDWAFPHGLPGFWVGY